MQFIFLSTSLRTFSLMAMLSLVIGISLEHSVRAAPQNGNKPEVACVPLADGDFFYELQGITFTPEQAVAYDRLEAKLSAREAERDNYLRKVDIPRAFPAIEFKSGVADQMAEEIIAAQDVMIRNNVTPDEQVRLLTQQYNRHAIFYLPQTSVPTPEQRASMNKDALADQVELMSFLTPAQRQVYQANLVRKNQIDACEKASEQDFEKVSTRLTNPNL